MISRPHTTENEHRADAGRLQSCYEAARSALLEERNEHGWWAGRLSTSALSTATAVMALEMVRRDRGGERRTSNSERRTSKFNVGRSTFNVPPSSLINGGVRWLAEHQNADGGWGDTVKSISNISTTMLAHAVFHTTGHADEYADAVHKADDYIERAGGVEAVVARYGKDKTFSVPILTHCALAGLVDWQDVQPLPFELACLPPRFYKTVRLPVVSYALPALIAIGQVRHHFGKPANPVFRLLRDAARGRSLRVLEKIQPSNGGFLEATPLTSFVTMSLAGMGLSEHPVARRGVEFIVNSVREDGSWPIDTNLTTWITTLSVNALEDDLPVAEREPILQWLLGQQYREPHPYTNADPGGWAWTDLPGGVPDCDDTPGAILAVLHLASDGQSSVALPRGESARVSEALGNAVRWLLDLQNRDGGWPTFCRGWGNLPFDRSAPDLTAHAIRALNRWLIACPDDGSPMIEKRLRRQARRATEAGFRYLIRTQREDGSWLPLWFGNQYAPDDDNPVYGTSRVLAAWRDTGRLGDDAPRKALRWLESVQNADGGWGGATGIESSVEETALAAEALVPAAPDSPAAKHGVRWLGEAVESGRFRETTPIGFYFAKLWYFERLYPLIWTTAALRQAVRHELAPAGPETAGRQTRKTSSHAVADTNRDA